MIGINKKNFSKFLCCTLFYFANDFYLMAGNAEITELSEYSYAQRLCKCDLCIELGATHLSSAELTLRKKEIKKTPWTLMVYMAADNDLRSFTSRNIQQM